MLDKGSLFIVSAPSGAGKTSLVNALIKELPNIVMSVSFTTRKKRAGEEDTVDYHFVTEEAFKEMLSKDAFLEYAEVFGNFYGTSRQAINEARSQGLDVILEIDWQGARQIRAQMTDAQSIFILPLSRDILLERLQKREEKQSVINDRMRQAKEETSHYAEYDYLIWNDQFEEALADLKAIIQSFRLETRRQRFKYTERINKLLS